MITTTRSGLWPIWAILLVSALIGTGCGSATGQQTLSKSNATPTAATTSRSTSHPTKISQTPTQPSGIKGQAKISQTRTQASAIKDQAKISQTRTKSSGIKGQALSYACTALSDAKQTCPRHPARATIELLQAPSGQQIATVQTDDAGRFQVQLPPGAYQLRARGSDIRRFAPPLTLTVRPNQFEQATVKFFIRHPLPLGVRAGASVS